MKDRYPLSFAHLNAVKIVGLFDHHYERMEIAGSIRRQRPTVGDIEIVYVPKINQDTSAGALFAEPVNATDQRIEQLEQIGILERRPNKRGQYSFGERIKLMRHKPTGIPVDLFSTTPAAWFNYLVCRTGGADSNMRIAGTARQRGFMWRPYSAGFYDPKTDQVIPMNSEREVFDFVGLPYEEPHQRP